MEKLNSQLLVDFAWTSDPFPDHLIILLSNQTIGSYWSVVEIEFIIKLTCKCFNTTEY